MRVSGVLLFLIAAVCAPVQAQPFIGGIVAGFTASQVDGDSYAGYNRLGLQGGVFVLSQLTPIWGARLEIRYASRGALYSVKDDPSVYYRLGLHYIDLPLSATASLGRYGSLEAGVVPGYLFAATGRDAGGPLPKDYLVEFRKFDLGTLLGVHVALTKKLSLSIRYSYSLFSIRDPELAGAYYSWFGKLFGHSRGDFNNYLTTGLCLRLK
jgi:hypothetical protein